LVNIINRHLITSKLTNPIS